MVIIMPFDFQKLMMDPQFQMGMGMLAGSGPGTSIADTAQGGLLGLQNHQKMQAYQAKMDALRREREQEERQKVARAKVKEMYPELGALLDAYPSAASTVLATQMRAPADAPSSVREWEYFIQLSPQQQEQFLTLKRALNYQDLGDRVVPLPQMPGGVAPMPNVAGPSQGAPMPTPNAPPVRTAPMPAAGYRKNPPPEQMPEFKGAQAGAVEQAKIEAQRNTESTLDFPSIQSQTEQSIKLLDELLAHPGLGMAVGATSVVPVIPGTAQADFVTRLEQIQGQQFLEAYQQLKGGGQITEVEGKKAEAAIARMNRAQSEAEFRQSVKDFRDALIKGLKRKAKKEGVDWSYSPGGLSTEQRNRLRELERKHGVGR